MVWIVPSEDTKCPSYFATTDSSHKSVMANTPEGKQLQIWGEKNVRRHKNSSEQYVSCECGLPFPAIVPVSCRQTSLFQETKLSENLSYSLLLVGLLVSSLEEHFFPFFFDEEFWAKGGTKEGGGGGEEEQARSESSFESMSTSSLCEATVLSKKRFFPFFFDEEFWAKGGAKEGGGGGESESSFESASSFFEALILIFACFFNCFLIKIEHKFIQIIK